MQKTPSDHKFSEGGDYNNQQHQKSDENLNIPALIASMEMKIKEVEEWTGEMKHWASKVENEHQEMKSKLHKFNQRIDDLDAEIDSSRLEKHPKYANIE